MRDPKRIPVAMNDIMHVWERFPDLRLGQLISSAMHGCGIDLYYIEDDDLVKRIQEEFKGSKFYGNQDNT